jgi:hypothetical protein
MAIDDPRAAFEQQYMQEEEKSPLGLAVFTGKLAFPKAGLPLEIFRKVADRFTRASLEERLQAMWHMLVMETEHLETTKASAEDVQEAIQLAMRRDAEEFNDKKRERYVKLIGNALRSETQIQDVTIFVQTVEHLGERDVTVLKVLNKIMNKEGDWKPQANPGIGNIMKLHPTTLNKSCSGAFGANSDGAWAEDRNEPIHPRRRLRNLQSPTGIRSGARDRNSSPRASVNELLLPALGSGDKTAETARRRCAKLRQLFQELDQLRP